MIWQLKENNVLYNNNRIIHYVGFDDGTYTS